MAALDLRGFNSGDVNFSGLDRIAATGQRNKEFAERQAERKQTQQDKEDATLASNTKFLQNTFDPKQHLTGTLYDPVTTQLMSKAYGQALQLAQQKVPLDQILMSTQPLVNKLNDYQQKASMYNANWKQYEEANKNVKGINLDALKREADKQNFYDTDPNTGIQTLNVDKAKPDFNYGDVIKNSDNPDVFNNESMNDFVKNSGHTVTDQMIKTRDARGVVHSVTADITKPSYMQPETDAQGVVTGFVPKYRQATEGDSHLLHTFKDDNGNDVQAPIRMVTDDVWDNLPAPIMAKVLQETRGLIKDHKGININSPQAEFLAKSIAYDELKNNSKDYSTIKTKDVAMQPLPPRLTVNVGGNTQPQIVNLYDDVDKIVSAPKQNKFQVTGINQLPATAQRTVLEMAKNSENDKNLTNADFYLKKDTDGNINVWRKTADIKNDYIVVPLDPISLNIPVNQNVAKVGTGKTKPETINKVIDTGKGKSTGKWDKYKVK